MLLGVGSIEPCFAVTLQVCGEIAVTTKGEQLNMQSKPKKMSKVVNFVVYSKDGTCSVCRFLNLCTGIIKKVGRGVVASQLLWQYLKNNVSTMIGEEHELNSGFDEKIDNIGGNMADEEAESKKIIHSRTVR